MEGWGSGTWAQPPGRVELVLVIIVQKGRSKMALASTNILGVEQAPQCLCPQGVVTGTSCLSGRPRSASRFDPGFFQITALVLGIGAFEILCVSFKIVVSIS